MATVFLADEVCTACCEGPCTGGCLVEGRESAATKQKQATVSVEEFIQEGGGLELSDEEVLREAGFNPRYM